jgi:hypothetical protein
MFGIGTTPKRLTTEDRFNLLDRKGKGFINL